MSEITISTRVAAPIEKVFESFTQLEKAVERVPGITSLEVLTEGPFGEGTRWRETRVMFKKEATEEMWVTGFTPPHSYTVEAESHGMKYSTLFEFKTEGNGTNVCWTFSGQALTFGARIMAPIFNLLMKGTMKKCMLGDLEAIGAACEQDNS
ncbi:MAG: SRPBCC family protein [bacterium]|nr:SRPBCC family protein [bacterium]